MGAGVIGGAELSPHVENCNALTEEVNYFALAGLNLEPFCHFDPFGHRRFLPTMKPSSTQTLFSQFICFKNEIRCKNEMLGFLLRFQSVRLRRTLSISHLKRVKGSFRRSRNPVSSLILSTYLLFQMWTDARIHGKSREAWVQQMG